MTTPRRAVRVPDSRWLHAQAITKHTDHTVSDVLNAALDAYIEANDPQGLLRPAAEAPKLASLTVQLGDCGEPGCRFCRVTQRTPEQEAQYQRAVAHTMAGVER